MKDIFNQQTNLLIGSQIIGKSFHFPNLKLVNIIDGDSSLFSPDFRAMEKTYQLLQQVAGRSGREGERGRVLIQTYSPQHPIFESIKNQNRDDFISMELSRREQNKLPPYTKIAQLPDTSKLPHLRDICMEILSISKKTSIIHIRPNTFFDSLQEKTITEKIFTLKESNYIDLRKKITLLKSKLTPKNLRFLNIDIDPLSIA